MMSAWPKTQKVGEFDVEFTKIANRKLAKVFQKIAFSMESGGGGSAPSTPSDEMQIFKNLEHSGDFDYIQDLFYEHMIIPGKGNVLEKIDEILEGNISLDFQLFTAAMSVYMSAFSGGNGGKAQ